MFSGQIHMAPHSHRQYIETEKKRNIKTSNMGKYILFNVYIDTVSQ